MEEVRLLQPLGIRTDQISRTHLAQDASTVPRARLSLSEFENNSFLEEVEEAVRGALQDVTTTTTSNVSAQVIAGVDLHRSLKYTPLRVGFVFGVCCLLAGICLTSALALRPSAAQRNPRMVQGVDFMDILRAFPSPNRPGSGAPQVPASFDGACTPKGQSPRPRQLPTLLQKSTPLKGDAPAQETCFTSPAKSDASFTLGGARREQHVGEWSPGTLLREPSPGARGSELCSELVVPDDRQCCVVVPALRGAAGFGARVSGRVADKQGRTILLCDLDFSSAGREADFERLALRDGQDGRLLAYVDLRFGHSVPMQCSICGPLGAPHARLELEDQSRPPSFLLRAARTGAPLLRCSRAESDSGTGLVFTEPGGLTAASAWEDAVHDRDRTRQEVHMVLASASADVGLVVLLVMALDRIAERGATA